MAIDAVSARAQIELAPAVGDCLLIIDIQNDFLPGGQLAVPEGEQVVPPLNKYIAAFISAQLPIIASRDWHPENHCSFRAQGGPWPAHCVKNTRGAEFSRELALPAGITIVSKAESPDRESYSDFDGTNLAPRLRSWGVGRVFVGGLATEYCVLATVIDALRAGFQVVLLTDAIRAINVKPADGALAMDRMFRAGAVAAAWRVWPDGTSRITVADRSLSVDHAAGLP